jgi:hypothetical protein
MDKVGLDGQADDVHGLRGFGTTNWSQMIPGDTPVGRDKALHYDQWF